MPGRRCTPPVILVFILVSLLLVSGLSDYGVTTDEARTLEIAEDTVLWAKGLIRGEVGLLDDESIGLFLSAEEHPSPAKVLVAMGTLLPGGRRVMMRLFPSILFASMIALVYSNLRGPFGTAGGLSAALALLLSPRIFGHAHLASSESVLLSLSIIGLLFVSKASSAREWAWAGAVLGLALGTKITALVPILASLGWGMVEKRMGGKEAASFVGGIACAFIISWPYLLISPLTLAEHILFYSSRPPEGVFYLGMNRVETPWHYAPIYLLVAVPPLILLSGLASAFIYRKEPFPRLITLSLCTGLLTSIIFHGRLHHGLRHILLLPASLSILSGILAGRMIQLRPAGRAFAAALIIPPALAIVRLHPAELSYYSECIGGLRGASSLGLELTYWGELDRGDGDIVILSGPGIIPEGASSEMVREGTTLTVRVPGME